MNTKTPAPKRVAKAVVISAAEPSAKGAKSKAASEDPWASLADETIEPPIDREWLLTVVSTSGELNRCIDVMATNVDGYGHRLVPRIQVDAVDEETGEPSVPDDVREDVERERLFLDSFFTVAVMGENGRCETFTGLRKRVRRDLESAGDAWCEVIRGPSGRLVALKHLRTQWIRLGTEDGFDSPMERKWLAKRADGSYDWETRTEWHRLRRYAQCVSTSKEQETRWFKVFGDRRVLDAATGKWIPHANEVSSDRWVRTVEDFDGNGNPMPWEKRASELVRFTIYDPASLYGRPRWLGETKAVLGTTAAEEINYRTFDNNTVPSMLVTVSNGSLTDASIDRIREFVETHVRGQRNYSQFLILEGTVGDDDGIGDSGTPKIDVKPLQDTQIRDVLFGDYTKSRNGNIRASFRFGSIFVGDTEDVNKSSGVQSRKVSDEQVFAPERDEFDAFVNDVLFPDLGIRWHRFVSRTPNVTDNQELVRVLASAERTGGVTPRLSRLVIDDAFPSAGDLPPIKGIDPDVPFSLQLAEAVKNLAQANEPGQQVAPVLPPIVPKGPKAEASALEKALVDEFVSDLLGYGERLATEVSRATRFE